MHLRLFVCLFEAPPLPKPNTTRPQQQLNKNAEIFNSLNKLKEMMREILLCFFFLLRFYFNVTAELNKFTENVNKRDDRIGAKCENRFLYFRFYSKKSKGSVSGIIFSVMLA